MLNYGAQPDLLGPLTAAQWSIWAAQQLRPEVPFNIAGFLAVDHDVDADRLTVACESAAARFGTPCARLSLTNGEPVFMVDRSLPHTVRCIDLRAESDPAAAASSWMNIVTAALAAAARAGRRFEPRRRLTGCCRFERGLG
jgi:hypothetical protein